MRRRRSDESGFALLVVLLMSAGIAIMLYQQLPRTAFESMRAKEEMLIERGEQYQRAIQLYVGALKKYPGSMEDLEKSGGRRFLRRRYKDPFTGKDDWRIIHVDGTGRLTDSLVEQKDAKKANQNTFITEMAGIGQTNTTGDNGGVNVALRKRASEGGGPEMGGLAPLPLPSSGAPAPAQQQQFPGQQIPNPIVDPNQQQQQNQQNPNQQNPNQPQVPGQAAIQQINPATGQPYPPGQAPMNPAMPPVPGQQNPPLNPGINPATGQPYGPGQQPNMRPYQMQPFPQPNQQPQSTNNFITGQVTQPPQPPNQFQQPNQAPTYPTQPANQFGRGNSTGSGTSGPGVTPQSALDMINQQLRNPSNNLPMNLAPGLQIGGGIAGIASKHDGPSIKLINEQQNYKKWEFIYDPKKDKRMQGQLGAAMAGANQGMNPGMQPGMNPMGPGMQPGVNPMGPGMNPGMNPGMQPGMQNPGTQPGIGGGFNQGGFGSPNPQPIPFPQPRR